MHHSDNQGAPLFGRERWSPWVAGAGIGVLSWATFLFMDKALGASTTFVRAVGSLEALIAPEHVRGNAYFMKYLDGKPAFEWQAALVLFMVLGAWLGARIGGRGETGGVPSDWRARFGDSRLKRAVLAFVGGAIMLFGARMAGGCTSGHAISGGLQLALSSWVFLPAMFISGILTTRILFGRSAR